MSIPCPYLGTENEKQHCKRPSVNVRGFKMHMTRQHGGATAEQIAAVIETRDPEPIADKETPSVDVPQTPQERHRSYEPTKEETSRKAKKAAIRLSNALSGVKEYISRLLPAITLGFLKSKMGIEGKLDEEGAKIVGEAWSAYFDLMGIDLENAEPVKIKLNGRKLMFIYPLMMIPLTLAVMSDVHKTSVTKEENKQPEARTDASD